MTFEIEKWTIRELISNLKEDKINLKPPYQRNFIWTPSEQKELIESIKSNYPLPSLFLYKNQNNILDVVDGQQRTRTILRFTEGLITDKENNKFSDSVHTTFLDFKLSITIITKLEDSDSLEEFYSRVNKTGKRLNDAELNKAEFFDTNFLKLVTEISDSQEFIDLNLFRDITVIRMNDRDFIEEIITLIYLNQFTDKKLSRDKIFKNDITLDEAKELREKFFTVLHKISLLNEIEPINKSRFRQKNDFYTLFSLIYFHPEIDNKNLTQFYLLLLIIGKEISPSNETSEYLREYAINCVSQSNSKNAREIRFRILEDILLNPSEKPNKIQLDIINYYEFEFGIEKISLSKIGDFFTLNYEQLIQELNKYEANNN